jgi:hypothetical protein
MSGFPLISNDSDLHAEGAKDGIDGFKAWVCARTHGFRAFAEAEEKLA